TRLPHVADVLRTGNDAIADVQIISLIPGEPEESVVPILVPIKDNQSRVLGLVGIWLKAGVLEDIARKGAPLGGKGSVISVLDQHGIRIANSLGAAVLYHSTGPVPDVARQQMVKEQRFGTDTAERLKRILAFPEMYERAVAREPDEQLFEGRSMANDEDYVGVARRLDSVQWTVFLMIPKGDIGGPITALSRKVVLWSTPIVLIGVGI